MAVLQSQLNTRSEQFRQNKEEMTAKLEQMDELYAEAAQGGGAEALERLAKRNKMPIRERIAWALDPDSPFLEISPLAAWRSHVAIGSGFVVGVGVIEGVECVILGHDPSVRAGAFNHFNSKKLMRGLEVARENRLPYVQFVESAGADLRGGGVQLGLAAAGDGDGNALLGQAASDGETDAGGRSGDDGALAHELQIHGKFPFKQTANWTEDSIWFIHD